ncbi:Transposase [Fusarium oxysporum f. sp. albedinis]|nr:Transposase [Fusarium oxysporum f. sp. albedinis]
MIGPRHIGDPGSWVTRVLHFSSTSPPTRTSDKCPTPLARLCWRRSACCLLNLTSFPVLVRSSGHRS